MKILSIHADYIKFKPTKKAVAHADDVDKQSVHIKECLVVFTAVEKNDESHVQEIAKRLVTEVTQISQQVKTKTIVLYPYAHLSSNLASPRKAVEILNASEALLKKKFTVTKAPFGWYKEFEIHAKGHPLSELSKQISLTEKKAVKVVKKDEPFFIEKSYKMTAAQRLHLSTAALIGKAVKTIFPEAEVGVCGLYHNRGYVDIAGVKLKSTHIERIEKKVKELLKKNSMFKRGSSSDVKGKFQKELLKDLGKDGKVYTVDGLAMVPLFVNPFVKSTKDIGAFKIMNVSSAYWKNNADNPQLTRLYTAGFTNEKGLRSYIQEIEAAEKRSHVNVGKELGLFFTHDMSPGSPFFLPKGTIIINELERLFRNIYRDHGYVEVRTPTVYHNDLWRESGHWDHFKENMFFVSDENMALKPMNCPAHTIIYREDIKSYRDLPLRLADFGILHRNEPSGTLHGLTRVRKMSQDDAHIFCTEQQIGEETTKLIELVSKIYKLFRLNDVSIELSTRPKKAMGSKKLWDTAETALKTALKKSKRSFTINPGDGAFYGPKIDFHVKDSLGRSWQLGTIQLDFQMPERFNLGYEGKDGKKHRPVMIHRAILGSMERFFGILIEHTNGNFPLWLSPVQVKILTITDRDVKFAQTIVNELERNGVRVELDDRQETMGRKVREAQLEKVNYILTIGDKEVKKKTLAVRERSGKVKFGVPIRTFVDKITTDIEKKVTK